MWPRCFCRRSRMCADCRAVSGSGARGDGGCLRLRARIAALLCLVLALSGGCCLLPRAASPIPEPLPRLEVEAMLSRSAGRIRTLKDAGISLVIESGPQGDRKALPTLGGVMAFDAALPGLWLLADKLGRTVFTLRALGDSFSVEFPHTREVVVGGPASFERLPHIVRPREVQLFFGPLDALGITRPSTRMVVEPRFYRFDVYVGSEVVRRVYAGRREVAINRIVDYDSLGRIRTEIFLDKYTDIAGIPVPLLLCVERPLSGGRLTLRLSRPKLNTELNKALFEAKRRAGWKYINLDYEPLSEVEAFRERE